MARKPASTAFAIMCLLALLVALGSARYFLHPAPMLMRAQELALGRQHGNAGTASTVRG